MENNILSDPLIKPTAAVLEKALGKNYKRFTELACKIEQLDLVLEWNYYNDGKSWLGKILNKKKNLCWLSVWDEGLKLAFFFTEKTISGVYEMDINAEIKNSTKEAKPIGKLIPVVFFVTNKEKLNNGLSLIEYKKSLK